MLQSCETLITKINEWQKAILELEKLSDEFLDSGDQKLKIKIENKKQEIINCKEEYQVAAYPELPNGQNLFWPEKELLEEFAKELNIVLDNFIRIEVHPGTPFARILNPCRVKNFHLQKINLNFIGQPLSELSILNFSLFQRLEEFNAPETQLKTFPKLPSSVKGVSIPDNLDIQIPLDLTILKNLEFFSAYRCNLEKLPFLPKSIEYINISSNENIKIQEDLTNLKKLNTFIADDCSLRKIPKLNKGSVKEIRIAGNELLPSERKRIKKEYPYAEIIFKE